MKRQDSLMTTQSTIPNVSIFNFVFEFFLIKYIFEHFKSAKFGETFLLCSINHFQKSKLFMNAMKTNGRWKWARIGRILYLKERTSQKRCLWKWSSVLIKLCERLLMKQIWTLKVQSIWSRSHLLFPKSLIIRMITKILVIDVITEVLAQDLIIWMRLIHIRISAKGNLKGIR